MKIADDILIASETAEQHVDDVRELLKRCKEARITLNRKKMPLGQSEVKFAGYLVGLNGSKVDPDKIEAVNKFPVPATRQDLRSFMGLVNQFRQFNQAVTKCSYKLKPLLSTKGQHIWQEEHDRHSENSRSYLQTRQVWHISMIQRRKLG